MTALTIWIRRATQGLPTALALGALISLSSASAHAQGFAAYISPPRFEVQVAAGKTLREVVEIHHAGRAKGNYRVYTNDWAFNSDHSVTFSDALAPDSCRPWVAIERRELAIEPGARYRYRFEIAPPPDTPPRECRFALMVEGLETAKVEGQLSFPVGGRIGVIVYASIGGAEPRLEIAGTRVASINGKPTALIEIRNDGNAHGRLEGFVNGADASGQRFELAPSNLPILPGETRSISLTPVAPEGGAAPDIQFPLQVTGELEWGKSRLPLDTRFTP